MIVNDWIKDAAQEIQEAEMYESDGLPIGEIQAVIAKHCPFVVDTVYAPVKTSREVKEFVKVQLEPLIEAHVQRTQIGECIPFTQTVRLIARWLDVSL